MWSLNSIKVLQHMLVSQIYCHPLINWLNLDRFSVPQQGYSNNKMISLSKHFKTPWIPEMWSLKSIKVLQRMLLSQIYRHPLINWLNLSKITAIIRWSHRINNLRCSHALKLLKTQDHKWHIRTNFTEVLQNPLVHLLAKLLCYRNSKGGTALFSKALDHLEDT